MDYDKRIAELQKQIEIIKLEKELAKLHSEKPKKKGTKNPAIKQVKEEKKI